MRSMFEINNGKIEIMDAADGFQGIAGIACEVAYPPISDSASATSIFQFIVVCEQKHNGASSCSNSCADVRIHASQQLRITAHFLRRHFAFGADFKG